jgi:hypothetical protein
MPCASQHREVSKTTQAWGSTRAACSCGGQYCAGQYSHRGCGSTRNLAAWEAARSRASRPPEGRSFAGAKFVNAPTLQAVSCRSVTRHLQCCARQYFNMGVSRLADCKSAVTKHVGKWTGEALPPTPTLLPTPGFRSRSRRGARLSTVSLTSASLVGTGAAHGSIHFKSFLRGSLLPSTGAGTRKIAKPRRLGRRDPRSVTEVPDHFCSHSSADQEPVTSHDVIVSLNSGGIPFV